MKLVRESIESLFEVGEATAASYDISYDGILKFWKNPDEKNWHVIGYSFITEDNDKYIVTFMPIGKTQIIDKKIFNVRVDFNREGKDPRESVNKGRMFKVLSTICKIIKNYIKRNPHTFSIVIIPGKTESGKETRFNLYSKYIKSQLPSGWRTTVLNNPEAYEHESNQVFQLVNDEKFNDYKAIKKSE